MPDSPGELLVVVDLLDTPKITALTPNDEPMEGLGDHLKEEDEPDEDQVVDTVVGEQQIDQEIDEAVREQQYEQDINKVEPGASDNSFYLGEEPEDESNSYYNPSRDC